MACTVELANLRARDDVRAEDRTTTTALLMDNIVYGTHRTNVAPLKDMIDSSFGLLNEGYTRFAISVRRRMYSNPFFGLLLQGYIRFYFRTD